MGRRLSHPLTRQLRRLTRPLRDLPFSFLCLSTRPCTWLPPIWFPSYGLILIADDPFEAFPNYHERQQPAAQTPQSKIFMNLLLLATPSFWTNLNVLHPSPALSLQCQVLDHIHCRLAAARCNATWAMPPSADGATQILQD